MAMLAWHHLCHRLAMMARHHLAMMARHLCHLQERAGADLQGMAGTCLLIMLLMDLGPREGQAAVVAAAQAGGQAEAEEAEEAVVEEVEDLEYHTTRLWGFMDWGVMANYTDKCSAKSC